MSSKDYFSGHSKLYAAYRPTYPEKLYEFIFHHVTQFDAAWDCATGNGQVAGRLAGNFKQVFATDISPQQIDHAVQGENIFYSISAAEKTSFPDNQFDLITVAQALHWFNVDNFYAEVRRVARQGAKLAVWGYEQCTINKQVDPLFLDYYHNEVGPYWDPARKLVEDHYRSIPFPFKEITAPEFFIEVLWKRDAFTNYLTTWSATQKFIREKGYNPVETLTESLKQFWNDGEEKIVRFPIFLKLGEI